MQRLWKMGLAVLAAVLFTTACGNGGNNSGANAPSGVNAAASSDGGSGAGQEQALKGKIVFATHRTDKADSTITDIAKRFMELHPGTEIVVEAIKDINTLKTRMAAGELPDLSVVPPGITQEQFGQYYLPIDDLGFTADNTYFYDSGVGADGKLYMVTDSVTYDGIVYNKKVFQQVGIDSIPTTKEQFMDVLAKLKAAGIVPLGSNFKEGWPVALFFASQFQQDYSGDGNYINGLVDQPLIGPDGYNLVGLNFVRELNEKGYLDKDLLSTNWDGTKRDLASGKIGMVYMASWYPPQVAENGANLDDIGMFMMPGAKGTVALSGQRHAISKSTKYPELAKAFYSYLFKEGKFALETDLIPISPGVRGLEPDLPFLKDLLASTGGNIIEGQPEAMAFTELKNKAQIDFSKVTQEYILSDNPQSVVDKYNAIWDKAKG